MRKVVLATTTLSKKFDLRAELALKTAKRCEELGYPLVVVDGGSDMRLLLSLTKLGRVKVYRECPASSSMGCGRRQALRTAASWAGKEGFVLWLEPEKYPLVGEIEKIVGEAVKVNADLVIPCRESFGSYPLEQQLAEPLGNLAFERATGRKLDAWFGVRLMNERSLPYFLAYRGEYGDKWDSITIPILRIIKAGLKVESVPVNYIHPPEQTAKEGTAEMLVKRIDQLQNLVPAIVAEAGKLKMNLVGGRT